MNNRYVADFETTTDVHDCRVWAWAMVDIDTLIFEYGNNIQTFLDRIFKENCTIYFHNLKFDGEFTLINMFQNGFDWRNKRTPQEDKEVTTLISESGVWYQFKAMLNNHIVTFINSLNIIPFSVDKIAKAFGLKESKLKINYKSYREINHELTKQEVEYIKNDCLIVAQALRILFSQNLTKITQGANALFDFKNIIGKKDFERLFPQPKYDEDIRSSYKGGWTYVNPKCQGKINGKGIVLDVNSLYPYVMYDKFLPYGEGVGFKGKYQEDKIFPLYIQRFKCKFELKEGYLPTIQIKNSLDFIPTQYLSSSKDELGIYQDITLTLTNVDLELMFEHYEVFDIEYIAGYKFRQLKGIFCEYIDKWIDIKIKSEQSGNKGMRQLAKLMLNALYGKFGLNPKANTKRPYLDEDGKLKFVKLEGKDRKVVYIPVATFITSYAREKTIRSAQTVYDRFLMSDTDSLHLSGWEIPPNLEIHQTKLGAWKLESIFVKSKYLRQKCYIESIVKLPEKESIEKEIQDAYKNIYLRQNHMEITNSVHCSGMPTQCHKFVTYDNFNVGTTYEGKLRPVHVKGGIVLLDETFTIKG